MPITGRTLDQSGLEAQLDSEMLWADEARSHLSLSGALSHPAKQPILAEFGLLRSVMLLADCRRAAGPTKHTTTFKITLPLSEAQLGAGDRIMIHGRVTMEDGTTSSLLFSFPLAAAEIKPPAGSTRAAAALELLDIDLQRQLQQSDAPRRTAPPAAPALSVIMLAGEKAERNYACAAALEQHIDRPFELRVAAPSHEAAAAILESFPCALVAIPESGTGPIAALNQTAAAAQAPVLLFVDASLRLLTALGCNPCALLDGPPAFGAATGRILRFDGALLEAGVCACREGSLLTHGSGEEPFSPRFNFRREVDCTASLFILTSHKTFLELKGLDASFRNPDLAAADYCLRLRSRGFAVAYLPSMNALAVPSSLHSSGADSEPSEDGAPPPNAEQHYEEIVFRSKHSSFFNACPPEAEIRENDAIGKRSVLCIGPGSTLQPKDGACGYERELCEGLLALGYHVTYLTSCAHPVESRASHLPLSAVEFLCLGRDHEKPSLELPRGRRFDFVWCVGLENARVLLQAWDRGDVSRDGAAFILDAQAVPLQELDVAYLGSVAGQAGSGLIPASNSTTLQPCLDQQPALRALLSNATYPFDSLRLFAEAVHLVLISEPEQLPEALSKTQPWNFKLSPPGLDELRQALQNAEKNRARAGAQTVRAKHLLRPFSACLPSVRAKQDQNELEDRLDLIIPVYNAPEQARRCIESVLMHTDLPFDLYIIDDCSPDRGVSRLFAELPELAASSRELLQMHLLRNSVNAGFSETVNRVLACSRHHAVLLNSDTEVPPNWLSRLAAPLCDDAMVGSVTPLSNNATICSFPAICKDNALPDNMSTAEVDSFVLRHGSRNPVLLPTGIGFCMFLNRSALNQVGFLDAGLFASGYGEENDWCARAEAAGYKNVAAANLFVRHEGAASFGRQPGPRQRQSTRNLGKVEYLHPGYLSLVAAFIEEDPLRECRDRIGSMISIARCPLPGTLYVTSRGLGGGSTMFLEHRLRQRKQAERQYVLEISPEGAYFIDRSFPTNPTYHAELAAFDAQIFRQFLDVFKIEAVFVNQLIGIDLHWAMDLIADCGVPYAVYLHDYYLACPSVYLLRTDWSHCSGETRLHLCRQCVRQGVVSESFFPIPGYAADIELWRTRARRFLEQAAEAAAPSEAARRIFERYYPGLDIQVRPHQPKTRASYTYRPEFARRSPLTIAVLGALGRPKGSAIVYGLRGLLLREGLDVNLVVIGVTDRHEQFFASEDGRFRVTGRYAANEAPHLLADYQAAAVLIPSIWPETFSYTTFEALSSGYPVISFPFGGCAELVQRYDGGWLAEKPSEYAVVNLLKELLVHREDVLAKADNLRRQFDAGEASYSAAAAELEESR